MALTKNPDTNVDKVGVVAPTLDTLNQRNKTSNLNTSSGSFSMPSLSVYTPDYGKLDASFNEIMKSFEGYKQAAGAQFDANKASLDSSLEQNIRSISNAKADTKEAFSKGREQLSEDVFMANRATKNAMSARGLGGSGVEVMANIQNRMAAGEKISDMSNDYFDAQKELVEAEEVTRTNYNNSLQSLNASLQSAMAQIMSQEASTRMDYTQTIENLKRQVIADTNAVRQAQAEWQNSQSQLSEANTITNTMVQTVLSSAQSDDEKLANLMDFGYTSTEARMLIDNSNKSAGSRTIQTLQRQIDNYIKLGYEPQDIKDKLAGEIVGYDIDLGKLNFEGSQSNTGKSLQRTIQGQYTSPTSYSGAYNPRVEAVPNDWSFPTNLNDVPRK